MTTLASPTTRMTHCEKGRHPKATTRTSPSSTVRRPLAFGTSILEQRRSIVTDDISSDRTHCPVCERYSQGPCGELFQMWLACADAHPGVDAKGRERHLQACLPQAQQLATCLEQHDDFYQQLKINDDNRQDEKELHQAWETLIQKELVGIPQRHFPTSLKPQLEFRPSDRLVVIATHLVDNNNNTHNNPSSLLLVFVQDISNTSRPILLAAGALNDLFIHKQQQQQQQQQQQMGLLQCTLLTTTRDIQVSALYETETDTESTNNNHDKKDHQVIYTYRARVPPTIL